MTINMAKNTSMKSLKGHTEDKKYHFLWYKKARTLFRKYGRGKGAQMYWVLFEITYLLSRKDYCGTKFATYLESD